MCIPKPPAGLHSFLHWRNLKLLALTVLFELSSLFSPSHLFSCCCSHNQRCLDLCFTVFFHLCLAEQSDSICVICTSASLTSLPKMICFLSPHFLVPFQVLHSPKEVGFGRPGFVKSVEMSDFLKGFGFDFPTYRFYFMSVSDVFHEIFSFSLVSRDASHLWLKMYLQTFSIPFGKNFIPLFFGEECVIGEEGQMKCFHFAFTIEPFGFVAVS